MAENTSAPTLTPEQAAQVREILLEQERILRYPQRFSSAAALKLGFTAASLAPLFDSGYTVTITRESDGLHVFQYVAEDKGERNLVFAEGKRRAALAAGHASPWAQLEAAEVGDATSLWANVPQEVPACGAFPIRAGDDWVATVAVSGLHDGQDHEVILRALEICLQAEAPRWDAPVA
jgi:uncharacterized protein (UPF0303 family)